MPFKSHGIDEVCHILSTDGMGNHPAIWCPSHCTSNLLFNFCNTLAPLVNDLYSSPNIVRVIKSRRLRWAGHVARMGEGRGVHKVLVGKPEGKRPVGIPRRRWEDNIKMDLQEVGRGSGDWMELAQDRDGWRALGSTVMNFGVR